MNPHAGREDTGKNLKRRQWQSSCSRVQRPGRLRVPVLTLAERGFKPVLFENANIYGMIIVMVPPHKEKMDWFVKYYENMLANQR